MVTTIIEPSRSIEYGAGAAKSSVTRDGPKTVSSPTGTSEESERSLHLQVTIRDNGIGFEPAYKDRIFELFQRLHGRDEYEGTGIGLAICKKIVERHAGTISAESKPGEGAAFTITLPLSRTGEKEPS